MSIATVNGLNFHYWTVGQGPHLILLHGLGGNLAVWHLRSVPLLRDHFTVTTYDLRGHGRSDMSPSGYTTHDMAEDLRGLMDVLGIGQAHLVGHSLGADISLQFALHYPARAGKLILVEPSLPALVDERKRADWPGWRYWADVIERYTGQTLPDDKIADYRYLLQMSLAVPILYGPVKGGTRKHGRFMEALDKTTLVDDYETVGDLTLENIATIPHPKLLIYDEGSPYLNTYRALCRVAQSYRSILLPPSGLRHFFPLEEPHTLVRHILSFVETGEPAPAET
ncbi:MAG: hypothetical protein DCC57_14595, partial [Chloroflexi bacterium]